MAETKICPYCGEEILAVAKKCKHCGEWLEEKKEEPKKQVPCEVCGEMIDEDALECPYCHEKVVSNVSETVLPPTVEHKQAATQYKVPGKPVAEQSKEDAEKEQGGIFMHYFFDVIKNHYADFHRSVTRKEYWLFTLFYFLTSYALWCLAFINFTFAMVVLSIYGLGVLIPSLAMSVCRLRDIGKKWTNLFFILIPIVGSIILLVFFCTKGKKNNKGNAKMKVFDYMIIVLAIVGMIALGSANDDFDYYDIDDIDDFDYYGYSSSSGSKNTDIILEENEVCIATWKKGGTTYSYILEEEGSYQPFLYQIDNKTKRKIGYDLSDGETVGVIGIDDYVIKNEKIVFIAPSIVNSRFYTVFYYDMNDNTFNVIDYGIDAEFVNGRTQVKVTYEILVKEGDCMANNEYDYEDIIYNL